MIFALDAGIIFLKERDHRNCTWLPHYLWHGDGDDPTSPEIRKFQRKLIPLTLASVLVTCKACYFLLFYC